jgi:hypothetical protein
MGVHELCGYELNMGPEQGFSKAGVATAEEKTGVDFVHARRPSKEEDETAK